MTSLIFSHDEEWLRENEFTSETFERTRQRLRDVFTPENFTDRERDHYFSFGEIYDNVDGSRKTLLGL